MHNDPSARVGGTSKLNESQSGVWSEPCLFDARRMHRAASERLCQQLLDSGLLKLLENVKAFFFLGRGELFHSLIQVRKLI